MPAATGARTLTTRAYAVLMEQKDIEPDIRTWLIAVAFLLVAALSGIGLAAGGHLKVRGKSDPAAYQIWP